VRLATRRHGMRLRGGSAAPAGRVRLGRVTKDLTLRLRPGEVAVIDHSDLDRVSAQALVGCRPAVVVNAGCSITGRYPNEGPLLLVEAGIPVLDEVGGDVFTALSNGDEVRLEGGHLLRGPEVVCLGIVLTREAVLAEMERARGRVGAALEDFADNTLDFLRRERDLLLAGRGAPELTTPIAGRQVLVVVRGYDYREDLASLRPYIRDYRPVLIGVDGGADALLEAGLRPDIVIGDMDSVTDEALRAARDVVVHAYPDGVAPGLARVSALGVTPAVFPTPGTSEDAALLLADAAGAELMVAVGSHASLVEFLDKGREGMASTFLTRLRVGSRLIDAKGVSRLYRSRISVWALVALVLATLLTFAAALGVSEAGRTYLLLLSGSWHDLVRWLGRHT